MRLIVVLIIGRSAKYCNLRVRVSACQSVSLSARISQKLHVHKVPWDARERRSCSSGYWQIAFLQLQVRTTAQDGTVGTLQDRLRTTKRQHSVQNN